MAASSSTLAASTGGKRKKEFTLVIRVKLISGAGLAVKDIVSSDPYCKVWIGPKGMMEPPETKGTATKLYYSTVQESTLNPVWGKTKHGKMTKALYKKFKENMIPLTDPVQDQWTFFWREGEAIHLQIWDKDNGSEDDYMGNVSFTPDITKQGPQVVTEVVHNGPLGQIRSKEKVSGTITIEWEWATKVDQLNVDQWLPLLQELTFGDERALSFLVERDLLPHAPPSVCRFLLSEIEKGNVSFPEQAISSKGAQKKRTPAEAASSQADWENEFADDDDDDDDEREPDGVVFLNLGGKVLTIEFFETETVGDIKDRIATAGEVPAAALKFSDGGRPVPDTDTMDNYSSATFNVETTASTPAEIAQKVAAGAALPKLTRTPTAATSISRSAGPSDEPNPLSQSAVVRKVTSTVTAAAASAGASSSSPAVSDKAIITQLAKLLFAENWDGMCRLLSSLPMDKLVIVSPILVACKSVEILALIRRKCEESAPFAARCRMIQNGRTQFAHLEPIVGSLPLGPFLDAFLAPDFDFTQGQVFPISALHPLTNEPFDEVKVVKIFSSLARPSILAYSRGGQPVLPGTLHKRGEDLYNETCLQVLFAFMNEIWEELLPAEIRPLIFGLRELPANTDRGFLEIVPDVRDLEVVERGAMQLIKYECDDRFIRTSCGWILAAYFLGLSDRHRENTLVRITDGSAIPIDFGFILGTQPPSFNTFCITISGDFYKYLCKKEKWVFFSQMFLAGFWAIRTRAQEFIRLTVHLFTGTDRNLETSARFVSLRMMLGKDMPRAMKTIYGNLRHAPICFYTRKKIEGHAKAKKIPARDDMIGALARKIGSNAAKPEKAQKKTGDHLHPGKVSLNLPNTYPSSWPIDLVLLLQGLAK